MKHLTPLTVRPYECDSYGHVNHAVYVNYLEHARMQFLHAAGFDYKGMIADGFFTVIARLDISYRSPAYADDAELQDALSHLGDVLGDVFGAKLNITGKQYGASDLLPAMSKVIELLIKKGFKSFRESVGAATNAMRGNANTNHQQYSYTTTNIDGNANTESK